MRFNGVDSAQKSEGGGGDACLTYFNCDWSDTHNFGFYLDAFFKGERQGKGKVLVPAYL